MGIISTLTCPWAEKLSISEVAGLIPGVRLCACQPDGTTEHPGQLADGDRLQRAVDVWV